MTPSSRAWWLVAAAVVPLGTSPLFGLPAFIAVLPVLLALAIAAADRLAGAATPLELHRCLPDVLSVGVPCRVTLEVRNLARRSLSTQLADEPPEQGLSVPEDAQLTITAAGFKTTRAEYTFTPSRRGRFQFAAVQVCHPSRLGLWRVQRRFEVHDTIEVLPNIEALHRFELLARVNNLDEFGVRSVRMKGEGTEFERLRDYRVGDEPRKVDWKASRRFNKLIVREMGEERNQNILLLIDMGRMMRQATDGLSHFDYALNTAIILGHVAVGKGDNVGAVFFSDSIKRFVPLGHGHQTVEAIVHAGYDLEPEPVATNYASLFRHVSARVRKRSLLMLITHFVPGEDHRLVRSYMQLLGRQHLPLALFFREPLLERQIEVVPSKPAEAFHRAAAADILLERHESLTALRHAGVLAADALPGELSAVAVGNYIDIKARNLL